MDGVTRIGVSLEPELLAEFDRVIDKKGYVSRSEAIRDLVRDSLAETEWKNEDENMCGVIVMVYDHEATGLSEKLTVIQHSALAHISASMHMHLDHGRCMEVITLEGALGELKTLANDMGSLKGVLRCKLTMASKSSAHIHHVGVRKD
ncbi:MAG: nickel-responsive transcriptional regulator NikR [archaeon]|nr:nickel-responsive transcriptional regulator NikR [archaeon]